MITDVFSVDSPFSVNSVIIGGVPKRYKHKMLVTGSRIDRELSRAATREGVKQYKKENMKKKKYKSDMHLYRNLVHCTDLEQHNSIRRIDVLDVVSNRLLRNSPANTPRSETHYDIFKGSLTARVLQPTGTAYSPRMEGTGGHFLYTSPMRKKLPFEDCDLIPLPPVIPPRQTPTSKRRPLRPEQAYYDTVPLLTLGVSGLACRTLTVADLKRTRYSPPHS